MTSTATANGSIAAHAPIISEQDGSLLGVVAAEEPYPSVTDQVAGAAPYLALYLGLGALLGLAGTWAVSRVVRRSTRGLGATELASLADHREALLHAIREGVVGVGTDGRVTVMNDAARYHPRARVRPRTRSVARSTTWAWTRTWSRC